MSELKNKRIITVATTGAWPKKENNPNVPLQPDEIAEEIYQCWKIGASVAHVHVRDEAGNDSMKVETFRKVIDTLRGEHPDCDIVLNLTAAVTTVCKLLHFHRKDTQSPCIFFFRKPAHQLHPQTNSQYGHFQLWDYPI